MEPSYQRSDTYQSRWTMCTGVRGRDAGARRAGAGAGGRVRDAERGGLVWAGGPAAETLGAGSLTASEEEDSAQTMTPVRFLLFILGTICRGGS